MRTMLQGGPRHGQVLMLPNDLTLKDNVLLLPGVGGGGSGRPSDAALALDHVERFGLCEPGDEGVVAYRVCGSRSIHLPEVPGV